MRLQYIFHEKENKQHPFYVKSTWEPPVQQSVALKTFLEEVKFELTNIPIRRPKDNLSPGERHALHNLLGDKTIIVKKADKGTTTVIMSREPEAQRVKFCWTILIEKTSKTYFQLKKNFHRHQVLIGEFNLSYDGCCNENVTLKLNFALGEVYCDYSMLITLDKILRQTTLSLAWYERFSCKGKEWKIYCCELALSSEPQIWKSHVVVWQTTSKHCTKKRAARAARLFFFIQPIKSLICGVVADVAVVKS